MKKRTPTRAQRAIQSVGVLADELRRSIYFLIREEGHPVTREEIARQMGISAKLAAFHLDKMAERGLLAVHYERPPGRTGPGAGRSAKYYRPAKVDIDISLPPRTYDVVGEMLVKAVEASGKPAAKAARQVARGKGLEVASGMKVRPRVVADTGRALAAAAKVLAERGFEPYISDAGELRLRNCPFHDLARAAPELVCGMNEEFITGLLEGMHLDGLKATLAPKPGECCVAIKAG